MVAMDRGTQNESGHWMFIQIHSVSHRARICCAERKGEREGLHSTIRFECRVSEHGLESRVQLDFVGVFGLLGRRLESRIGKYFLKPLIFHRAGRDLIAMDVASSSSSPTPFTASPSSASSMTAPSATSGSASSSPSPSHIPSASHGDKFPLFFKNKKHNF